MSLYFFNIDGEGADAIGVECDRLASAKCEAVQFAGQVLCDDSETFWDTKEWGMTVTNAAGLSLFSLAFFATEAPAIS